MLLQNNSSGTRHKMLGGTRDEAHSGDRRMCGAVAVAYKPLCVYKQLLYLPIKNMH